MSIVAMTPLLFVGCGGGRSSSPACPHVAYETEIPVGATSTTMLIDTHANVLIADDAQQVHVDIRDNWGTVAFGGSDQVPAFIYRRIPWPQSDLTLLSGMGVITHDLVASSQVPLMHAAPVGQGLGAPTQNPDLQVSLMVQYFPSLQIFPSLMGVMLQCPA